MRPLRSVLFFCVLLCAANPAAADGTKRAQKLLKQLRLVDGAGSMLDADLLRGKSPDDIGNAVRDAVPALSVQALAAAVYRREASKPIPPGGCPGPGVDLVPLTVVTVCDDDNDILLSCALSNPGLIRRSLTDSGGCAAIACDLTNNGFTSTVMVVCLAVP